MRYILSSSVITTPGYYSYKYVTLDEAKNWLNQKGWRSFIGYHATAEALSVLTDIKASVDRRQTVKMNIGDEALIFRLKTRVNDSNMKGNLTKDYILNNFEVGILKKEIPV